MTPSDWNVPENVTKVVILFRKDGRQMYVERDAEWLDRLKAENEQRLSELETALREVEAERDELLGLGGMQKAYEEHLRADAAEQRVAELEAALREIKDVGDLEGWGFVEDIVRRALGGGE